MKSGRDAEPGRRPLATGRSLRCILFPHGFASDDIRHLRRRQHGALMQFIVKQTAERMRDTFDLIVRPPAHPGDSAPSRQYTPGPNRHRRDTPLSVVYVVTDTVGRALTPSPAHANHNL